MGGGNCETEPGIGQSLLDFFIVLVMLGLSPSVFVMFRAKFEVEVPDEVLEGGHEFGQWATGFDLELH